MKRWAARIVTAVVVLFLVFDAAIHIVQQSHVVRAFAHLGYPMSVSVTLGVTFAFPIAFGVLVWVGLLLRDDRLRTFIALKG